MENDNKQGLPTDHILYDVAEGVATITLNRPKQLNAMTPEMAYRLIELFDQIDADDQVRAVIVTGNGRAFCAGADMSAGASTFEFEDEMASAVREDGSYDYSSEKIRDIGGLITLRIFDCLKPVIAAINGPAVGVGITMTLAMDIRLASDTAKVGFVFARRGIAPESACGFFLPRIVGISTALEWCYSGRVYKINEISSSGLVRDVYPQELLLEEANKVAQEIAKNSSPVSIALTRQMLWRGLDMKHPMQAHKIDSRAVFSRGRSSDATEGVTAFFEKRQPKFRDKVSKDMPDFFPWWENEPYC